jgi:hypothetical protein
MERLIIQDGTPYLDGVAITLAEAQAWAESDPQMVAERDASIARTAVLASLTDPLVPKTVTGSTVAAVKASADAAVKDIAAQTEARLAAVADVLGT